MTKPAIDQAVEALDAARLVIKGRDQEPHEMRVMQACQIAIAALTAEQSRVPPDREPHEAFDTLHIEHLVNEWFAPLGFNIEQSHIDGLCAVLRKRLSRLALPAAGDWRPIESAPKDGTHILLSRVSSWVVVGFWEPNESYRELAGHDWFTGYYHVDPTHWQPRPAPPSKEPGA